MNTKVILGIVGVVVVIIIIAAIMQMKSTPEQDNTMSELSKIMKDPAACKKGCKTKCKSAPIISFTGDGRRKCKKECYSSCAI
jgi:CDP-diacylglycerol pyrophosphatase